jgi:outer membrane cobalamin receptor
MNPFSARQSAWMAAALAAAGPAPAAEPPDDGAYSLGEVVVSATRPAAEDLATLREVTDEDIERRAARNLSEAIALLPGVNVRVGGDGAPRIDVRGLRTRHVKLLVNGVPFNNTFDGQFDPTLIPTEQIARIKLITGTASELYGDGGLGAVINIITKAGTPGFRTKLRGEGGSWGHRRLVGSVSGGTETTSAFLSLSHQGQDGFRLADDFEPAPFENGAMRINSDRERTNLYSGLTYRPADTWELGATFNFTGGSRGIPPIVYDNDQDPYANRARYDRLDGEAAYYGQISAAYTPDDRWTHRAWAYVSVLDEDFNRYTNADFVSVDDPHGRGTFRNETTSYTLGFHHQTTYTHDFGGTLSLMVEARSEHFEQDCQIRDVPPATTSIRPAARATTPAPAAAPATTGTGSTVAATVTATAGPPIEGSRTLEFTRTTTNGHGATNAAGENAPIARLTLTDRPNRGIDFSLTNLAGRNYGAGSYLSRLYLLADRNVPSSTWTLTPGADSQASFGNSSFGGTINDADGYPYLISVNFQRPGGNGGTGDPLLQGETARWSFGDGRIADLLAEPARRSAGGEPMAAALVLRGTEAQGFWGASGQDLTGQGLVNRVHVQAPAVDSRGTDGGSGDGAPSGDTGDGSGQGSGGTGGGGSAGPDIALPPAGRGCGGGDGSGGGQGNGSGATGYFPGIAFGLRQLRQERELGVVNGAAELSFTPFENAEVLLGYGHHWLITDAGAASGTDSFTAGLSYRLTADLRLRGGASRKIRTPSIRQLYDVGGGNPNLGFETGYLYETGLTYSLSDRTRFGVTGFINDVYGFIERDPVTRQFRNYQHYEFRGLEFTGETQLASRLKLRASYTRMASQDRSDSGREEIQYVPGHKLAVEAHYDFGAGFTADASYAWFGEQFHYSRRAPYQKAELAPYGLLNGKIGYTLATESRTLTVYLGVDNLLDENYAQSYGYPQAGRFVYGGIEAGFF